MVEDTTDKAAIASIVERLAKSLYWIEERQAPEGLDWSEIDEAQKDFYRRSIAHLFGDRELVIKAVETGVAQYKPCRIEIHD